MAGVPRDVEYDKILSLVIGTPHGRSPEFWQGILQCTIDVSSCMHGSLTIITIPKTGFRRLSSVTKSASNGW